MVAIVHRPLAAAAVMLGMLVWLSPSVPTAQASCHTLSPFTCADATASSCGPGCFRATGWHSVTLAGFGELEALAHDVRLPGDACIMFAPQTNCSTADTHLSGTIEPMCGEAVATTQAVEGFVWQDSDNNYGDCVDAALLLVTCLLEGGLTVGDAAASCPP